MHALLLAVALASSAPTPPSAVNSLGVSSKAITAPGVSVTNNNSASGISITDSSTSATLTGNDSLSISDVHNSGGLFLGRGSFIKVQTSNYGALVPHLQFRVGRDGNNQFWDSLFIVPADDITPYVNLHPMVAVGSDLDATGTSLVITTNTYHGNIFAAYDQVGAAFVPRLVLTGPGGLVFGASGSASVPELSPLGTALEVKLGDGSAYTDLNTAGVSALKVAGQPAYKMVAGAHLCFDATCGIKAYELGGWLLMLSGPLESTSSISVSGSGVFYADGAMAVLQGQTADGATATGIKLQASTVLSTAGAKIVTIVNGAAEKANIDKDGMLRVGIGNAAAAPTCDATQRMKIWTISAASGSADTVKICLKSAADAYSWVQIATGG